MSKPPLTPPSIRDIAENAVEFKPAEKPTVKGMWDNHREVSSVIDLETRRGGGSGGGGSDGGAVAAGEPLRAADYAAIAIDFLMSYRLDGYPTLLYEQGLWRAWQSGAGWFPKDPEDIKADIRRRYNRTLMIGRGKDPVEFLPSTKWLNEVYAALTHSLLCHREPLRPPCWLPSDDPRAVERDKDLPPASEFLSCANGLLHVPDGLLWASSPRFYSLTSIPFDWVDEAACPVWLETLNKYFNRDQQAIGILAEIFGYIISGRTNFQKIFIIYGPKRSGKSTMVGILGLMLGEDKVINVSMADLAEDKFAWEVWIDASLAVFSEETGSGSRRNAEVTKKIKSISGEDLATIRRMHSAKAYKGRLGTRIMFTTNGIPEIADPSNAIAARAVILQTFATLDYQDPDFDDKLLPEMPGIFRWSIEGLQHLIMRGHFEQSEAAKGALDTLSDMGSPIETFVAEYCDQGPSKKIEIALLYRTWRAWCRAQGIDRISPTHVFSRDLKSVVRGLSVTQAGSKEGRRSYEGIALNSDGFSLLSPDGG